MNPTRWKTCSMSAVAATPRAQPDQLRRQTVAHAAGQQTVEYVRTDQHVFPAASIHDLPVGSSHHERAIDEVGIMPFGCSVHLHQEEILHLIVRVDEHEVLASR